MCVFPRSVAIRLISPGTVVLGSKIQPVCVV
jgi:hypothetical protein